MTAADFRTSIDRLVAQAGHWEQSRWSRPRTADTVYALVQHLADLGADAENRPHRRVPRVSDLVLIDQVRVMADDLLAAGSDDALRDATAAVDTVRRSL